MEHLGSLLRLGQRRASLQAMPKRFFGGISADRPFADASRRVSVPDIRKAGGVPPRFGISARRPFSSHVPPSATPETPETPERAEIDTASLPVPGLAEFERLQHELETRPGPPSSRGYEKTLPGQAVRLDDAPAALIRDNGKLLIGDWHDRPEGMVALAHVVETMPVKTLFVEQGVSDVLENEGFMTWLKAHPDASRAEVSHQLKAFLAFGPRAQMFVSPPRGPACHMTVEQAADLYWKWMEMEAAVAQQFVKRGIPVKLLFTSNRDNGMDFSSRKPNAEAWEEFRSGDGLRVLLAGENHCVGSRHPGYGDQELYGLLEKSDGIFLRTPASFEDSARMKSIHCGGSDAYSRGDARSLGVWRADVRVHEVAHRIDYALYRPASAVDDKGSPPPGGAKPGPKPPQPPGA